MAAGRPTKLTPAKRKQIVDLVRDGVPLTHAALAAGVGKSTVFRWMAQGDADQKGVYRDFREAIRRAEAESVAALVAQVLQGAAKDWRAAAWLLTRRAPADFIDPAKVAEMQAAQARAELTVAESAQRVRLIEARAGAREGLKRKP